MAIIPIENIGKLGIIVDDAPHNLPPEALTDGQNVRFGDNAVRKSQGQIGFSGVLTALDTPTYKNVIVPTGVADFEYSAQNAINAEGSLMVIGAIWKTVGGLSKAGQAYLYDLDAEGLHTNERAILPDTSYADANFGTKLAMSADGTVIAVAAYRESPDGSSTDAGAVYVYNVDELGAVSQVARLAPTTGFTNLYFGVSIEISDDGKTLVIGSYGWDVTGISDHGAAFVYTETAGTWSLNATLEETTPVTNSRFGVQATISGDATRIAVGARTSASSFLGEVHIFKKASGVWPAVPDEVLVSTDVQSTFRYGSDGFGIAQGEAGIWGGRSLRFTQDGVVLAIGAYRQVADTDLSDDFTSSVGSWSATGAAAVALDTGRLKVTGSLGASDAAVATITVVPGVAIILNFDYEEGSAPTKDLKFLIGTTAGGSDIDTITLTADFTDIARVITPGAGITTFYLTAYLDTGSAGETFFFDNIVAVTRPGAVYTWQESGGSYGEDEKLAPTMFMSAADFPWFGWTLDMSNNGTMIIAGMQEWNTVSLNDAGAAVMWLKSGTFAESALIESQDNVAFGYYGFAVAISGDGSKFIVGDTYELDGRSRTEIFAGTSSSIPNPPHWLLPWKTLTEKLWIYPGVTSAYRTDGTSHLDITRYTTLPGDDNYDAGSRPIWTGGVLHGVPVMTHNNLTDPPQQWDEATTRLKNLENWPSNTFCKVLRTYKNFLIALDITKSSVRFPYMVKWSSVADPGTVPGSWDETDATVLAGENTLAQTNGWVIDCVPLGDVNVVYKQDSLWGMQFIGGVNVFRFYEISTSIGALAPRCVKEFYKKHLVVGQNDIVLVTGNQVQSIVNKRMRKWFFNNLHPNFTDYTVVALNPPKQELWICFVEAGSTSEYLTKALIWNWDSNTWAVRDLPDISHLAYGNLSASGNSFDVATGSFDTDVGPFDGDGVSDAKQEIMFSKAYLTSELFHADTGYTNDGTNYTSYIERTGLSIAGVDRQGNPKADPSVVKFVRAVYPKITAPSPVILSISVGSQDTPNGPITWEGPYDFNTATDTKVDFRVSGKFIAYRIEETGSLPWEMTGLGLDIDVIGEY